MVFTKVKTYAQYTTGRRLLLINILNFSKIL